MGSPEHDELLHDIRQSRKDTILDEWEQEVRKEYHAFLDWFAHNPDQLDNYMGEEEKLDLAYEILITEGKGGNLEDVVHGYRERKAWELAEREIHKPEFID